EAERLVRAHPPVPGPIYTPTDVRGYDAANPISVIIATARAPAGGADVLAFFFTGQQFLGYDTALPSSRITLGPVKGDTIELRYQLFDGATPTRIVPVVFHWDGKNVTPLETIPDLRLRHSTQPRRTPA
ncbi:MAG: LppP/LprE family lipoprotein, partial [Frankia sp.]